MRCYG